MAWTSTTFLARFPEFNNLEASVVTATIQEAERQNDSDIWGDQYDDAVLYFTAHLLASRTQAIGQQVGVAGAVRVSVEHTHGITECNGVCREDINNTLRQHRHDGGSFV